MAFILKDRIKETTTTSGTGDISLGGAASTFETFSSYMTNGDTTYYAFITQESGVDEWEVGVGTWNTGNTLSRTTVLAGSNGTSAVNFSAGDKDVFMTYPAAKSVYTDTSGDIDINGGTIDGTTVGATNATTGKFTTLETTSNVDIGGYIDLEVLSSHAAYQEGRIWYDSIHKTINFYSDDQNVIHELGIEEHQRVFNTTGSTILKGKPLYFSGNYTGGSIDVPTVGLADATDVNAYNAQGLAASDIPNNSYGYCIIAGQLDGFDTSGLNAGTNFFVGLTPGAVQNESPLYPNFPMCLGWVVNSDATDGTVLVNQQNHSVNSFRVRTSAHVGSDLQVDGNLTVLGSTTSVSTSDVTAGAPFYRANEGDAIGEAGTTFSGTGLDDAFFAGHFTGTTPTTYYVKIDGVGTGTGGVDTFAWSTDNFVTSVATGVDITGNEQLIHSADNISVTFSSTTGHTLNDQWNGTASPINVDSGFFTNYNTGTSGVGYTHTGFYYDASEGKWVLLSEYDPVPAGAIDLADSSTVFGTIKAGLLEGNVSGNVTGNVTGTATSAVALATARNIGGVSFNGTADINLPGVNTTGNQDTTGNAATATTLETARTVQLSGDVTGSATFDGSANINITAAVQDDSHAHVISNVDGLQTALDAKVDNTTTITSGNYLTGGGDLSSNRTLDVDATSNNTASKVVARDASGNFSAGTITGALSGNATTASSLATARNIAVTGAVTGNANFDGSGNISISTTATSDPTLTLSGDASGSATFTNLGNATLSVTVADDSHNHVISNVDGLQTALDAKLASSSYTASDVLTKVKTVDGSGSGLNADLLDGNHASAFYLATNPSGYTNNTGTIVEGGTSFSGTYPVFFRTADDTAYSHPNITFTGSTNTLNVVNIAPSGTVDGRDVASDGSKLDGIESGATADQTASEILTAIKTVDGSGSGLDADTVDGIQASGFATSSHDHTILKTSGNYQWSNSTTAGSYPTVNGSPGVQTSFVRGADGWPDYGSVLHVGARGGSDAGGDFQLFCGHGSANGGNYLRVRNADNSASPTDSWTSWRTLWDSGNDGSGSGLDADLLDGVQGSSYLRSDQNDTMSGVLTVTSTSDSQILLQSTDAWTGIGFNDSGNNNEYIWHNGSNGTFSIGGNGSNVSGKKLHVNGGLSVGASSGNTSTPSNGIYSEGQISVGGEIVLRGTGRIQGVDTVSSGTDAANKNYVDTAVASAGGDEQTATTTSTSQTAIATYTASSSLGLEITVIATNTVTTERTISKLLVTHDNTTAVATEYGTVNTDATIATFDVDISGGNVRLLATAASTNSTNYTAKAVILA